MYAHLGNFLKGIFQGASNVPIFSDEERVRVGTLYKQTSREGAFLEGLDFIGPKLRFFIEETTRLAPDKKILIHCWRGGLRSQSMAVLIGSGWFFMSIIGRGIQSLPDALPGGPHGSGCPSDLGRGQNREW